MDLKQALGYTKHLAFLFQQHKGIRCFYEVYTGLSSGDFKTSDKLSLL